MRKSTLLWLLLAVICGAVLFHTSQRVHDLRERIVALEKDAGEEEESIRVLEAEWGYLNQPERLEKLARAHLGLVPLKGRQFAQWREFPLRAAPAEGAAPAEEQQVAQVTMQWPAELPPPQAPAPPAAVARTASHRSIGDVIKGLEVE